MRKIVFWLALKLFVLSLPLNQGQAVTASQISALGTTAIVLSTTNLGSSIGDCVCNASSTTCPKVPWGTCAMIGLTAAQLVMAFTQNDENNESGTHFDPNGFGTGLGAGGAGSGAGGLTGVPPLPAFSPDDISKLCTDSPELCNGCAKSGDFTSCTPQLNIPEEIAGFQSDDPEIANALGLFEEALGKINESLASNGVGAGGAGLEDQVDSGFSDSEVALSDPVFLKKSKNKGLGAEDTDGLGKASIWGMDLVDEKSGKKLTLFQRARRRYYNAPQNKRLNYLARAEFIRAKAIHHAKMQEAKKQKLAEAKAKRAPAAEGDKISQKNLTKH